MRQIADLLREALRHGDEQGRTKLDPDERAAMGVPAGKDKPLPVVIELNCGYARAMPGRQLCPCPVTAHRDSLRLQSQPVLQHRGLLRGPALRCLQRDRSPRTGVGSADRRKADVNGQITPRSEIRQLRTPARSMVQAADLQPELFQSL